MAAYREDQCEEKDWAAPGFYSERANQDDKDQYLGEASNFDYNAWVPSVDESPEQKDAPGVSIAQLTAVAPYSFDSSKC